jgi:NitT/TauT family transport system ATP-binding protein
MTMTYLIEYDGVKKSFAKPGGGENLVLNGIDLKIKDAELVCLVGGSGSGKSTVFGQLLGSQTPSAGEVRMDGKRVQGIGPDRGIVPQAYSLFPDRTVLDNIAFGPDLSGTNNVQTLLHTPGARQVQAKAREDARKIISQLDLDPADADRWPYQLSGGMQQRVAIGSAIIMRPRVLMMDEPFSALDPLIRKKMQQLTLKLWKDNNLTIIFVTHSLDEAVLMGTRVIGLSKYWLDENGQPGKGSTIVLDRQIPGDPLSRTDLDLDTPEFREMTAHIYSTVIDTARPVRREQFDLSHPDAMSGTKATA